MLYSDIQLGLLRWGGFVAETLPGPQKSTECPCHLIAMFQRSGEFANLVQAIDDLDKPVNIRH